jgi:hypothetical protein
MGIAVLLSLSSQLAADEHVHADIAKLYEEFNAALRQIGPSDSEGLSRFYTKAHRAANQCAFFDFNCRTSARIFNQVITLTEYEIVSIETNVNRSVDLMVLGKSLGDGNNAEGVKVGLVVNWLFEEEKWRIDSIMKGPPDRDSLKRRFSIREQRPQPVAPRD